MERIGVELYNVVEKTINEHDKENFKDANQDANQSILDNDITSRTSQQVLGAFLLAIYHKMQVRSYVKYS
jgi:hypothetical protein